MRRGKRAFLRGTAACSVIGLAVWAPVLGSAAHAHAALAGQQKLKVRDVHPKRTPQQKAALKAALRSSSTTMIPTFDTTFTDGASSNVYNATLVGADPLTSNSTTKIVTPVIPIEFDFAGGGTYDATVAGPCSTAVASRKTLASPLFRNHEYTFGGTGVGRGQYTDIFRRAEFWSLTGGGLDTKYHTKLIPRAMRKLTVTVPAGEWNEVAVYDACNLGEVDFGWLDNYLENVALPSLASAGVSPSTFPLFLTSNVVSYSGSACCILGFHSAFVSVLGGVQTYAIADYESTGAFIGAGNVSVLSHEIGEWMDDPYVINNTDPWGNIGQVQGCQFNNEVGDPLTGTGFVVPMGKTSYNLQELAFQSWFYRTNPSPGVNSWYSLNGTFTSPAAPC